ncbi:uncharacterized protein LOC593817 [Strongylocentrotus purpuratus]|uniref:Death domain-containing protein n=1 Tax=Strongylocentrotus purpuratus TaxID=7668 RepID=A0A7M7RG11_STRPU|nr:uncharacterized protein LOC593817 [Strongylocentrotus purpuratus]|eukprot:XP_800783.1 PREDICTED: uncharacterized protein LOC593817 [Strongylocentrotus purpuratus]
MAKRTRLSADVTLRMANQFEATNDSKNDTIRSFGDTLNLDKLIIKKATTLGKKSSNLEGATQHLLNEWVNEHGSDDEAAKRLKTILTKNGYSKMADVIKEESTKKSSKHSCQDPQQPASTTDRIITLVTTVVVAVLAITYIHYRDFS